MKTLLEFLYKNRNKACSCGVSMAVAVEAAKKLLASELKLDENEYYQDPIIWGDGWYAIYKQEYDDEDGEWFVSPKKYFEEYGSCMDGWEQEIPHGMTVDEFEDYIDMNGCEPNAPEGFSYCMEMAMSCTEGWDIDKQRDILREAGFIVDNVPKWHWDR